MEDDGGPVVGPGATPPREPARSAGRSDRTTTRSTREQDGLRDLIRRERRAALVYGSDVEAWLRSEGADSGRLQHEGRKLRRAIPGAGLVAAWTAGALVAGVALVLSVVNLFGQGWPGIAACLSVGGEALALAVTAWASARLQDRRGALRSRLAWIEAIERERQRMACEVVEVSADGITVHVWRNRAARVRPIPTASVASCEVRAEGADGRHVTVTVVTKDGARTLFRWIPTASGAADAFEAFARRTGASIAKADSFPTRPSTPGIGRERS